MKPCGLEQEINLTRSRQVTTLRTLASQHQLSIRQSSEGPQGEQRLVPKFFAISKESGEQFPISEADYTELKAIGVPGA